MRCSFVGLQLASGNRAKVTVSVTEKPSSHDFTVSIVEGLAPTVEELSYFLVVCRPLRLLAPAKDSCPRMRADAVTIVILTSQGDRVVLAVTVLRTLCHLFLTDTRAESFPFLQLDHVGDLMVASTVDFSPRQLAILTTVTLNRHAIEN